MDPHSFIILLCSFIVLFLISAFFSGAEVAFVSLVETKQLELKKRITKRGERIRQLLNDSNSLLLAIKMATIVVYIALVGISILISEYIAERFNVPLAIILTLTIIFVAGILVVNEIWTSRFALAHDVEYAEHVSFPIMVYYRIVSPFVKLVDWLINFISKRFHLKTNLLNHHKILAMMKMGEETTLEDDERAMIHSIIEFGETEVHEIMVPRIDMICVEDNTDLKSLIKLINEKGHSRIPLFCEDVDHILGIIHAKDLLPYITSGKYMEPNLKDLARPGYFVPESKKLHHLLKEFQQEKHHMAIVVDEYGGTAGLVTLEDVIEEIVGDIQDEYDRELPLFRKLEENVYTVDAKIDLHELNASLEIDLPTEGEYDSLGGFILSLTGYVPEENEVVNYDNYSFIIQKIDRNRIISVKLSINPIEETEEAKKGY